MKPYKFLIGGYDDEKMTTKHGRRERKSARRGLRTRVDLELSDYLFSCNENPPSMWNGDYDGWISA